MLVNANLVFLTILCSVFVSIFAVSDTVITTLCLTIIGAMSALTAWLQARTKAAVEQGNENAKIIAEKQATKIVEARNVSNVGRAILGEKVDKLLETTEIIHGLSNSRFGIELKMVVELSRWKAEQLKKEAEKTGSAEDIAAASMAVRACAIAEEAYANHMERQAEVDQKGKT